MNLFKAIHFFIFLFTLALATELRVYRDKSISEFAGDDDAVYLWSAVATFGESPRDGQLVQLAEDAWRLMADQIRDQDIEVQRRPTVMSAFGMQTKPNEWTVYLASSARGSQSLVYNYDTRTHQSCGSIWDTVPHELQQVISQCSRNPTDRHMFDAKCGEINALINYYVRTGESVVSLGGKDARMVAWRGFLDEDLEYQGGNVIPPCWDSTENYFGCSDVLRKYGTTNIQIVNKRTERESYECNMPLSVDFQPVFPEYN